MTFADSFEKFCAFHESRGFAVHDFLHPPASEEAIAAAETAIGFSLPDELKALWRCADGQVDPFQITDPAPGTIVCPFFGSYDFVPVARARDAYIGWRDIFEDAGDSFDEDFNGSISVRGDDPVAKEYWRPGWVPFTIDGGGNSYAVDLAPAPGGTIGQVIVIGPDEDERRVLAPGIAAFMEDIIARAPPLDPSMSAGEDGPVVYGDFERR